MKFKTLLFAFLISALCKTSFAGGSEFNSYFGARTLSLNGLYFGGVDGLTSTINNPAGLAFLNENTIEVSVVDQLGQHVYRDNTDLEYRSFRNDDFSGGGGLNFNFGNFSAAVVYAPAADYRVQWPYLMLRTNDTLSVTLSFNMFNRIQINSITPSVAMRFGENFSAGISANIYMINFNSAFPQSNYRWYQGQGFAAYQFEYKLDAWAYGFTLGIMADLNDNLKIGASARSGFTSSLEGTGNSSMFSDLDSTVGDVDITTDLEMPWVFGIGAVYSIQPDLKINVDAKYSMWSNSQEKINFEFSNQTWQNNLAHTDSVTGISGSSFNFSKENSLQAGLGVEYFAAQNLILRFGYRYDQTPNTADNYNLLFPNVNSHSVSLGLGIFEENFSIDAAVLYTKGIEKEINTGAARSSGRYDLDNIVPVVTLRYKFN